MVKLLSARDFIRGRGIGFLAFRRPMTAIDVDGQVLRVVQAARRRHGAEVTHYVAKELDGLTEADLLDPAVVGAKIGEALRSAGLKPKSVVMGVPRARVVLRTLRLPVPDDPRELAAMVYFQAAKELPFPVDEAVIDFKVRHELAGAGVAEGEPRTVEVLVAAVQRSVVESYQRTAATAGLTLKALGLRSYANARCVGACNLAEPGGHVALVSLRPDEVIIDLLEEDNLVFSRVAEVASLGEMEEAERVPGAADSKAAPSFAAAVTIEVVRTLHSHEGISSTKRVDKVVVAGGTGQERAVVEALQSRLSVPCYLLNPARALGLLESSYAPGAMAVFGLGLGINDPEGLPFDFLKPKRPMVKRDSSRTRVLVGVASVLVVLMVVAALFSRALGQQHDRKNRAAALVLSEREKSKKLYRPLLRQVSAVNDWRESERRWLDHIVHLSSVLPSNREIYLRSISSSGPSLRLAVQARSGEVLSALDRQLRAAGYEVKPVAYVAGSNPHGYPFQTTVELEVTPDLKVDLRRAPAGAEAGTEKPAVEEAAP